MILVTSHRRESWGADLESICAAARDIVAAFDDVRVVFPVHLNPAVRDTVYAMLGGVPRIDLLPPVDYLEFIRLMDRAYLILTDSGGVQEEAPSFRKPVLVLRHVTERPEAALSGLATLVGADRARIVGEASRLLTDREAYRAMTTRPNPYGDGRAAERIVKALRRWAQGEQPLLEAREEFGIGRDLARVRRVAHGVR
jgi:UDP-N-acetylglucosamine 2-epimerase (non-hydrolysing)